MNINIEITDDQLGAIITNDLADAIEFFRASLNKERANIFSTDPTTDKIMIMKHIEAFKLVQEWYI